jgi:hypothetical protein
VEVQRAEDRIAIEWLERDEGWVILSANEHRRELAGDVLPSWATPEKREALVKDVIEGNRTTMLAREGLLPDRLSHVVVLVTGVKRGDKH